MKNVTITLDDEVVRWVRARATESEISVSRLVGGMLREMMVREQGYHAACELFDSFRPSDLREPGEPLPVRGELHDRAPVE